MDSTQDAEVFSRCSLLAVMGSVAYGLAREGSDLDRLGVYVADIRDVVGLRGQKIVEESIVHVDPDYQIHEVGKFLRLGLKANPTILELLWAKEYIAKDETGERLIGLRGYLLSEKMVRSSYGGYVLGQLNRIKNRADNAPDEHTTGRVSKHARHCFRLLRSGEMLLRTGNMTLDVGDEREEIFTMGELAVTDFTRFETMVKDRVERLDGINSVLGEYPDTERVNRELVEIRLSK